MYESRCYEESVALGADGTVMGLPNEQPHCFYLMKYVLYLLIRM